jgi:hypothetical protein
MLKETRPINTTQTAPTRPAISRGSICRSNQSQVASVFRRPWQHSSIQTTTPKKMKATTNSIIPV